VILIGHFCYLHRGKGKGFQTIEKTVPGALTRYLESPPFVKLGGRLATSGSLNTLINHEYVLGKEGKEKGKEWLYTSEGGQKGFDGQKENQVPG